MEFDTVSLYFSQAIAKMLEQANTPLITEYSLNQHVKPLLATGRYGNEKILRLPNYWGQSQLRAMIRTLVKRRILAPDEDFKAGVWRVVQAADAPTAEEAICLVDPFAYISHLSAMQRYGITDRSPEALHITTPSRTLWTQLRNIRMAEDYKDEPMSPLQPQLSRIGIREHVRRRHVVVHETKHPADPTPIASSASRIARIGRVFVDMLDQPALCGGIRHILDCYDRHAEDWLEDIIAAVDATDNPIVKVRAGYIFEEMLGLSDPRINRWAACAQRGGSRKMDPQAPYGQVFSEKWMIAINV